MERHMLGSPVRVRCIADYRAEEEGHLSFAFGEALLLHLDSASGGGAARQSARPVSGVYAHTHLRSPFPSPVSTRYSPVTRRAATAFWWTRRRRRAPRRCATSSASGWRSAASRPRVGRSASEHRASRAAALREEVGRGLPSQDSRAAGRRHASREGEERNERLRELRGDLFRC